MIRQLVNGGRLSFLPLCRSTPTYDLMFLTAAWLRQALISWSDHAIRPRYLNVTAKPELNPVAEFIVPV